MSFRKFTALFIAILTLMACAVLTGCQSQAAQTVDEQIYLLVHYNDVSLHDGDTIQNLQTQIELLSEEEYNSLRNIAAFETHYSQYKILEDNAVAEIEAAISEIPNLDAIRLKSEAIINKAIDLYASTTDIVKKRISNIADLEAAKIRMEEYKEACWVQCQDCGGDGRVVCSLCNGSGSRPAYHTTPNGQTWLVSQDCKTSSSCSICLGKGGYYQEP